VIVICWIGIIEDWICAIIDEMIERS